MSVVQAVTERTSWSYFAGALTDLCLSVFCCWLFFLNLLPSEFWKYVICLVQAAAWLMALICCDCMLEIPNLYRGLEITIIITLLAFKASL